MHDQLSDGRNFRIFNVIDDFNREAAGLVNAPMERFFRRLKTELPEHGYTSQGQAEADVLRYLTGYYKHPRPHRYNGYKTPVDAESMAG